MAPKVGLKSCFGRHESIYALLHQCGADEFDVVYIGMAARGGIRGRLRNHKRKKKNWSHFTIFEVWRNVGEAEVSEIEGLFREIYSKDQQANRFNKQKKCKKLQNVRQNNLRRWLKGGVTDD